MVVVVVVVVVVVTVVMVVVVVLVVGAAVEVVGTGVVGGMGQMSDGTQVMGLE